MKELAESFVQEHLMLHIVLVALSVASLLAAMVIDLASGILKAHRSGVATTSTGLKKTAAKARKYFMPYLALCCIDFITSAVIPVPAFSMLWAAYCIWCEFLSVREKSWQKEEMRKAERTMSVIIENKSDIAKMVAQMLFNSIEQQKKKEETKP